MFSFRRGGAIGEQRERGQRKETRTNVKDTRIGVGTSGMSSEFMVALPTKSAHLNLYVYPYSRRPLVVSYLGFANFG
jgi:hypothetical protein